LFAIKFGLAGIEIGLAAIEIGLAAIAGTTVASLRIVS